MDDMTLMREEMLVRDVDDERVIPPNITRNGSVGSLCSGRDWHDVDPARPSRVILSSSISTLIVA